MEEAERKALVTEVTARVYIGVVLFLLAATSVYTAVRALVRLGNVPLFAALMSVALVTAIVQALLLSGRIPVLRRRVATA